MLVRDIMSTEVLTVGPGTTLPEAIRLARARGVRHLPVLDRDELVGIVSDRDLKRAMASPATSLEVHELHYLLDRLTVGEIMTRGVITVDPDVPVEDAASLLLQEKISALPVTEGGRLVGIVTETDLLRLLVRAFRPREPSTRIEVELPEAARGLADVIRLLEAQGAPVTSVLTFPGEEGATAVFRVGTIHPGPAVRALTEHGYTVRHPRPRRRAA